MAIDVQKLSRSLESFIQTHQTQFQRLSGRQSQLLEIGALSISAKHYEIAGYDVKPRNLQGGEFRVKLSARGHPWNYSWFSVQGEAAAFEIHGNLPMEDARGTPGARYVVDVAVVEAGTLPPTPSLRKTWKAAPNRRVVTFVEAKALVIYPMLIAQFIGIVHELKPAFLAGKRPRNFVARGHFDPALVSLGYLHGTCRNIVGGLEARRCRVGVVAQFDAAISNLARGNEDSPFKSLDRPRHRANPEGNGSSRNATPAGGRRSSPAGPSQVRSGGRSRDRTRGQANPALGRLGR